MPGLVWDEGRTVFPGRRVIGVMALFLIAVFIFPGCSSDKSGVPVGETGDLAEAHLSFAPDKDQTLKYATVKAMDMVMRGMDISNVESYEAELSLKEKRKENFIMSLYFARVTNTVYRDGEPSKRKPPIDLEGKKLEIEVARDGEVLSARPDGSYITGIRDFDQLREIAAQWLIHLPDSTISIGGSWTEEIDEMEAESEESEEEYGETGTVEYKLVGLEVQDGLTVAVIESTSSLTVRRKFGSAVMEADGEGEGKYYVAVDGGYLVKADARTNFKGLMSGGMTGGGEGMETGFTITFESDLKR